MTPTLYYTKRQWLFHRFTTSSDEQPTLWHIFTHGFCTTFDRLIPLSADIFNNYHHLQHTPSTYPLQPLPVTLHLPDHVLVHHHHPRTTQMIHLLLPLHHSSGQHASANNPHYRHSTHRRTGTPGMGTLTVASSSSKATPSSDPIGSLLPKELKDLQKLQDNQPPQPASPPADLEQLAPPPPPQLPSPNHISPTPISPANTPPPPSQADFSPSPTTTPRSTHDMSPHEASPLQLAAE